MAKILLLQASFLLLVIVAMQLHKAAAYRPLAPAEYANLVIDRIFGIGPACCKAILGLDANCWPKILPANPFFRPLVKVRCARTVGGGSPGGESTPERVPAVLELGARNFGLL
ncbi:hypothetical protein Ancab_000124 [Ancistrocladus abbreviatus]